MILKKVSRADELKKTGQYNRFCPAISMVTRAKCLDAEKSSVTRITLDAGLLNE